MVRRFSRFAAALAVLMSTASLVRADGPIKILCLGDSYTAGTGVKTAEAWPAVLAERIRYDKHEVATPTVVAHEGWTADELLNGIEAARPEGPFDLVTVMIGVNDQYRGGSAAAFRPKLVLVVARAIALAGNRPSRVVIITVPDYSVTPFGQQRDPARTQKTIHEFNATIVEVARLYGLRLADVTPVSEFAGTNAGLVADDGLHPSAPMHGEWAGLIYEQSNRALLDWHPAK